MGELFHVLEAVAERASGFLTRLWTRHPLVFWLIAVSFFILSTAVLSLAMVTLLGRP
jgi:drug/metabolite transporter superfamily protein YnfA